MRERARGGKREGGITFMICNILPKLLSASLAGVTCPLPAGCETVVNFRLRFSDLPSTTGAGGSRNREALQCLFKSDLWTWKAERGQGTYKKLTVTMAEYCHISYFTQWSGQLNCENVQCCTWACGWFRHKIMRMGLMWHMDLKVDDETRKSILCCRWSTGYQGHQSNISKSTDPFKMDSCISGFIVYIIHILNI